MRRLLVTLVAWSLLVAACGGDDEVVATDPGDDVDTTTAAPTTTEEVTMPVDLVTDVPPELPAGEVELTFEAVNVSDEPVTLTFPSGQEGDAQLIDADGEIAYTWSASRSFIQMIQERPMGPGERLTVVLDADLSGVPAGAYTLELSLTVQEPPAPVRTQVEVVSA
jgi:hypothetical protein